MSDSFSALSFENVWEAIKTYDLGYLRFLLKEWYLDNIDLRIRHNLLGQRCENCRNWHFKGRAAFEDSHSDKKRKYGTCDLYSLYWEDYHGWCPVWNIDFDIDEQGYTTSDDGWERVTTTPAGKKITQVSKSGIWMYKHDGEMK
jgi:hypothetical protein